jgi:hypothetical protein
VLKELSCSCNVQPFEKSKCWFFQCLFFIYFVKRTIGDYCLMILGFSWGSFVSIMEERNVYKGGGGQVLFAKYNFYLSYIFINKIIFSYIIFVKSGSTLCTKWLSPSYSDCIFFKTFFTLSKPKATNSRASDCYLTPTQPFSAISWWDQVNFQWDDVCFVLDQDT